MSKKIPHKLLIIPLILAILLLASSFLTNLITNDPTVANWLNEHGLGTSTRIVILVVLVILIFVFTYWQGWLNVKSDSPATGKLEEKDIESDFEKFFTSLKKRYQNRFEQKLDGRFEITLEVSKDWKSDEVKRLKTRYSDEANIGEAVQVINEAFEKQGRLLIVGSPGAGKTVLLLKLAISLLEKVNISKKEAIPVIFNLASWSSEYEKFEDWLSAMLQGNGLSREFAATLLHQERIVFLLDGLDELARNENEEIASKIRADCLKSLNQYLQRGRKAVICCRRNEFKQMQTATMQDAPVSVKVEVLDLTKAEVILALEHARNDKVSLVSADNLLNLIQEKEVLLDVLSTPFYFTTALEVFDTQILKEENLPPESEKLKNYLLKKFIEAKLFHTSNPHGFKSIKTRKWLKWLANTIERKQLITFELAELRPTDLLRKLIFPLISGFINGLFLGLAVGLAVGLIRGLIIGLVSGLVVGLLIRLDNGVDLFKTEDVIQLDFFKLSSWNFWKDCLPFVFTAGLFGGLLGTMFFGLSNGIAVGFVFGIVRPFEKLKSIKGFARLESSYQRIYGGFVVNLIFISFLVFVSLVGIMLSSINHTNYNEGIFAPLWLLLITGSVSFGIFLRTVICLHFILRFCLYIEDAIPFKYATFLDYAAEARILEKDGGHWRFRHQNLQEYFANLK